MNKIKVFKLALQLIKDGYKFEIDSVKFHQDIIEKPYDGDNRKKYEDYTRNKEFLITFRAFKN